MADRRRPTCPIGLEEAGHPTTPATRLTKFSANRSALVISVAGLGAVAAGGYWIARPEAPTAAAVDRALLQSYCTDCHSRAEAAGGIAFEGIDTDRLAQNAEVWERAVRKIRAGLMPPKNEPRPERAVLDGFAAAVEHALETESAARPNPGTKGASRLNRTEYANAIRDLLAYDASAVVDTLPRDESSGGFDNSVDALTLSPTLIEGYLSAAMRISRSAIGDRTMIPTLVTYAAPRRSQARHVEGLPPGTRGGMQVTHNFPLDAEYEIRVNAQGPRDGQGVTARNFCDLHMPDTYVTFDGSPLEVENPRAIRMRVAAGPRTIAATLADNVRCAGASELYDFYTANGGVDSIQIQGPFAATGPGDTPSRRAIFVCRPETSDAEDACARRILASLATRGYRRRVADGDPALEPLLAFYRRGRFETDGGTFDTGIEHALSRLLIDARFLFRLEDEPAALAEGDVFPVTGVELASRLSFFLWSSIPDAELLAAAAAGELAEPTVLDAQVRRMLADPRAAALVDNFAGQWLKLREFAESRPEDPGFDEDLRDALRRETEMLFADVAHDELAVPALLDAPYTYLNERSAAHYGIDGVRGSHLRRVSLAPDSPRRGLLGQGSILTATSAPNRTSPVKRGQWIIENLLGSPVPVPPPGVEADLSPVEGEIEVRTLRERLELHLGNPSCASCHATMDGIGLALENFDLVGRWRERDNGYAIDAATSLVDGTPVAGPADVRAALVGRSDAFVTSFTERLLTYALGRPTQHYDMPAIRKIVHEASEHDFRFSAIVLGIAHSAPFRMKTKTTKAPVTIAAATVAATATGTAAAEAASREE